MMEGIAYIYDFEKTTGIMRKVSIEINYYTQWGEYLAIKGEKSWNTDTHLNLTYISDNRWSILLELPEDIRFIDFRFLLKKGDRVIREENGIHHSTLLPDGDCNIQCLWQDNEQQKYFQSSLFYNSIFKHNYQSTPSEGKRQFVVNCLHIEQSQELVIAGTGELLGDWDIKKAPTLKSIAYGKWLFAIPEENNPQLNEYKFAIRDKFTKNLIEWEKGKNRIFAESFPEYQTTIIETNYRKDWINWKASGVAIPVFSLRSEKSFGIGEFSDLRLLIDWATKTRMKIIQVLPINDTTSSHSWRDSYPYSAISIYALHPIYLGLNEYPLQDKIKNERYIQQAKELNKLATVDYEAVLKLKTNYLKDLFAEAGEKTLKTKQYKDFFNKNKEWLFPYACFCYLRDKYKKATIASWKEFSTYDVEKLEKLVVSDEHAKRAVEEVFFVQFLLHTQLSQAKDYAYQHGVALKGDIPIGISPNSVEAWTEPHLFNLDSQTGAPPDDFSVTGQNWGFPTYNWDEMAKDNYSWWRKRFIKMSDYFDAYRIDHILGFFRIWEIPQTSVNGLLGYFSPALPLLPEEIREWGYSFLEDKDIVVSIHAEDVDEIFGTYSEEVKTKYLFKRHDGNFALKEEVNTQKKIQNLFHGIGDKKETLIRDGLYRISCEVLFVRDKKNTNKFHPRISLQHTFKYKRLPEDQQRVLNALYQDFFYKRHTSYWKEEAMKKLPTLIKATDMLVCGEDLGMIPDSVPEVMKQLEILSLEIQRMPKELGAKFSALDRLPYLSVLTTSTHDMSPLRLWWKEDKEITQEYFNNILQQQGEAPDECNPIIAMQIIGKHLKSPAMLTILPLQDWLSISQKLKRENPEEERINVPADPCHYWNYRMHITLEYLLENEEFSEFIRLMNEECER